MNVSGAPNAQSDTSGIIGMLAIAAPFAVSSIIGFTRANNCKKAKADWTTFKNNQEHETYARAEAARKEALAKTEAIAEATRRAEQERLAADLARRKANEEAEAQQKKEQDADHTTVAAGDSSAQPTTLGTDRTANAATTTTANEATTGRAPSAQVTAIPRDYQSSEGYQKALWGMSRAEVKRLYPTAEEVVVDKMPMLGFQGTTAGHKTLTAFGFTNDKLAIVIIVLTDTHTSAAQYLSDFSKLKTLLTKKYGSPKKDEVTWRDRSLFVDSPDHLGTAVTLGHAALNAIWDIPESILLLTADQGDLRINVRIAYMSKVLFRDFDAAREQAKIDDL
ncbi:hypothetical protein JQX13_09075 [Archangium violaceum]|uniref:hypothetical protein n=1 Tax=Archangium violaceum TaxID=83451 RepID=UPI00193BD004|nr:hypothetical protein [Archangium violaceum]QRK10224.1 hypothetical protein JQX13_09075 [Archangium violaceum]